MKSGSLIVFVLAFSLLGCLLPGQCAARGAGTPSTTGSCELPAGLVVSKVRANSEAERAGFRVGDLIQLWRRGGLVSEIGSVFDLFDVQIEQEPLGAVTLEGLRNGEHKTWTMGVGFWDLHVRPNFPEDVLPLYLAAADSAMPEKPADKVEHWRTVVVEARKFRSSWLVPWLLSRAAMNLAQQHEWTFADGLYQQAIRESGKGDSLIRSRVLHQWAETFEERSDWTNAEKLYQQSLVEARKLNPESLGVAAALISLGDFARNRGDLARAEEFHRAAFPIRNRLAPGSLVVAQNLNKLGSDAFIRGNLAQSEQYYLQALDIEKKLDPGGLDVANTLAYLGHVALKQDHLAKAEECYRQSLAIQEKLAPGTLDIALILDNLGVLALERTDLVTAEKFSREALMIEEQQGHGGLRLATTLNNLGLVAKDRGDLDEAEKYQRQALAIREKLVPGTLALAASLEHFGALVLAQGKPVEALDYLSRSLVIKEKLAPNSLEVATTLNCLGEIAWDRGDLDKAEDYYRRALAIVRRNAPDSLYEAENLNPLGDIARSRRDLTKAEEYYRGALKIREQLSPGGVSHAESLAALAAVMQQKEQWDAAAQLFEQALNALESQTARLGGSEESRSTFRANHANYYSAYIDLLLSQKKLNLAFQVVERFRARSLVEMLTEAHIDIRKGVDGGLLQLEQALRESLGSKSAERIRLLTSKRGNEAAAISHEISDLLVRYQQVEEQIRQNSPGYTALTRPQALSAYDVQQQLLDSDTLLLEYYLGEDRSYVWAITTSSVVAYELPKRVWIDEAARRLYSLLTARNHVLKGESLPQQQDRWADAEAQYPEAAAALSSLVLGPVMDRLQAKRLLIVSDGALQYIPFALLPLPEPSGLKAAVGSGRESPPLMVTHEIVNLPSASVLSVLKHQNEGRKAGTKQIAVLADPVFDKDDARVKSALRSSHQEIQSMIGAAAGTLTDRLIRSAKDVGIETAGEFHLTRLPFTREEADMILKYTPAGEGMEALDFKASRETITSQELSQYRIVHFATHAIMDNRHPELSGLVLSLVDEEGRPVNGFLDLQEIYNLNLPADLVVLSACATGLGKEIRGEGMVGLTRGFMYAGAARVMSSLWQVDDFATAKLMGTFYKAMQQEGMQPAAALRKAQMEMLQQKSWSSPYYWAGFQLQGQW